MALAILAVAALTGCNDYDDPRPPTGEGRSFAATRLVSVLIPWIVGGVALTWYHLSRPREGRPGRAAAIGSGLCFFVAIVLGVVALLAVAQLFVGLFGSSTRGEEDRFIAEGGPFAWIGIIAMAMSLNLTYLGLAVVRRGGASR